MINLHKRIDLKKVCFTTLLLIMGLSSYSWTLVQFLTDRTCGHPLLFIPDSSFSNTDSVNVDIEYFGPVTGYSSVPIFNATVGLTDPTYFTHIADMTIAGVLEHIYRFTYSSYSPGPDGTLVSVELDATDQAGSGIISAYSLYKSCHPCNTCPSRFAMSYTYQSLAHLIFNSPTFPDPTYNGAYASLSLPVQTTLATVMNYLLNNSAPTYTDYIDYLDPDSIGYSVTPAVFCNADSNAASCICHNQFYNLVQAFDDSIISQGIGADLTDTLLYYCFCLGDYIGFSTTTTDGFGMELTFFPLEGNIPSVTSEVYFDAGTPYAAIGYSNYWLSEDATNISYNGPGTGTFSYSNGFMAADSTLGSNCNPSLCDSVLGTSHLQITPVGNLAYQFVNTGTVASTYINWILDGTTVATTLSDTFTYEFPDTASNLLGWHVICLQTAHVFPLDSSCCNYICCYDEVCDSIFIDSCDFWRATDTITYVADTSQWNRVCFTFHGYNGIPSVLIWNFGDGSEQIATSDTEICHLYPLNGNDANNYNVCVVAIWSLIGDTARHWEWSPDSSGVCCCMDTICTNVPVSPCNARSFTIVQNYFSGITGALQVIPSATVNITNVYWYATDNGNTILNGNPGNPFITYTDPDGGILDVCADISYYVTYDSGGYYGINCTDTVCATFNDSFSAPRPEEALLRYYPNPTNNQITVEVKAHGNDEAVIVLSDFLGQPVINKNYGKMNEGKNALYLPTYNLLPGIYEMRVTVGSSVKTVKVVKE